jgi:hypothetical protein
MWNCSTTFDVCWCVASSHAARAASCRERALPQTAGRRIPTASASLKWRLRRPFGNGSPDSADFSALPFDRARPPRAAQLQRPLKTATTPKTARCRATFRLLTEPGTVTAHGQASIGSAN